MNPRIERELHRTEPDYIVYVPGSEDGSTFDSGNEHFLVFNGPDGSLMASWTQSTYEGAGDHRVVFARSRDEGATWSEPRCIAGPSQPGEGHQANWGFPLVSQSGRIYVIYNQYQGITDVGTEFTGTMDCVYSDDLGESWSAPATVPMRRSPHDHPDPSVPSNWIVWQHAMKDLEGRYFVGFTRWVSKEVRTPRRDKSDFWAYESVVEFMRFLNIDEDPEPQDIRISWHAWGEEALKVPHYDQPALSVAQEPSIVRLPDSRIFCVMRTMSGCIWYSVSEDDGHTWRPAAPLRRWDHGPVVLQPICCCPIYPLAGGRYLLVHHNNDGRVDGSPPQDSRTNRHPCYVAVGEFRPGAYQPLWFSESRAFMATDGVPLGPRQNTGIGIYSSFTIRNGRQVLWHPDRKFFLLGKEITPELLEGLAVRAAE